MRAFLLLPLGLLACGNTRSDSRVRVETNLVMPRAVLGRVTRLTMTVFEGDVTCNAATGIPSGTGTELISKQALASVGCATGATFCGDLQVEKSASIRVFQAIGTAADGAEIASGCTTATLADDRVALSIKMKRFVTPAVCGDAVLQPTEQCLPGGTAICDSGCQSNELLLSIGSTQNGTSTGSVGDKTNPAFVWPTGSDQAGWLFAFYTDRATGLPNGKSDSDIGLRVMGADLLPVVAPPAPVAYATASFFMPNGTNGGNLPPTPASFNQSRAQAAVIGTKLYVAFQDEDAASVDVHMRAMDVRGTADARVGINGDGGGGEPAVQGAPSIAASNAKLFIAWEDQSQGKISGRSVTPPSALGSQNDISTGTGNARAALASTPTGWVVVWQSGTGVKLRAIAADGTPEGVEKVVNEGSASADKPRVAALDDGRFLVAWTAGGDVFAQRYDRKGVKIPGDQVSAINDAVVTGTQSGVAVCGTSAVGGSYALAWLDEASGHVRARYLGGSTGFLVNHVNGLTSEFQASRIDARLRATPTVAAGGAGPFVAIGWEDKTSGGGAGVVARRFPMPESD